MYKVHPDWIIQKIQDADDGQQTKKSKKQSLKDKSAAMQIDPDQVIDDLDAAQLALNSEEIGKF